MRKFLMISVGAAALGAAVSPASAAETDQQVVTVDPVTVISTRTERKVDEVPASVSVFTDGQIENMLATDIKDLIRFEPGVSVPTSPARFSLALSGAGRDGNSGFTIRGMGGNRVLIINDGVRVPDGFAFGAQSVGRGGYNDLDLVKSVEILRGPASALYGSDGIAGAVSFTSKDPADFIDPGANFGARARVGYNSADDSWSEGVALAGRAGSLSGLIAYTRRDGHETENQGEVGGIGATRTEANPLELSSNAVLGKLVWEANANNTLRLTVDHYDSEMDGEALSSLSSTIAALTGHDETDRNRVSLDWRFSEQFGLDNGSLTGFWQQSETKQFTFEDRVPAVDRTRDVTFDNSIWGVAAQGSKTLGGAGVSHRITFGADYSKTEQEGLRNGTTPPVGETFPIRAFPKTEYQLAGVFLQDEIELLDGRLSIIPALRYDWYELTPKADALYPAVTAGQSDDHLSPKIGAIYWADPHFGIFANYAVGFKSPSPMQVNNFFENPVFGYRSIPNPDLAPETSESIEGGFRFRDLAMFGGDFSLSTTAFKTRYEDFIDQTVVSGTGIPGVDPLIYQYINLNEVDIWGLEARGQINWDNGFSLIAAASFADGQQTTNGQKTELGSIDPFKLVTGLNYVAENGVWGGSATVTYSDKKKARAYNLSCGSTCWTGEDFTLLDVTAWWNVTERATLRAGVFNALDEKYGWWSDVRGLTSTSTVKDAYTQPGRNFGVSLSLRL